MGSPEGAGEISGFGVKIAGIPTWVIGMVALAGAVVALLVFYEQPQQQLITVKQANDALRAEITELGTHIGETPDVQATLMNDGRGRMGANRYSDACVVLYLQTPKLTRYKLVVDMSRDPHGVQVSGHWFDLPAIYAAAAQLTPKCHQHSDGPKTWEDRPDRCWLRVHRQWSDGCYAVQMVDVCHGGTAEPLKWIRCVSPK